jgi:hypothetical protein
MKGKQKNQMIEEEGEEFEELSANSIDRLQEHGINVADINKLKAHGTNFYLEYNYGCLEAIGVALSFKIIWAELATAILSSNFVGEQTFWDKNLIFV